LAPRQLRRIALTAAGRVARSCGAVLVVVGFASPARAQGVAQYLALARQYAAGQGADAVARLETWSREEVEQAGIGAALTATTHDLIAAAVLHTDLANAIIDGRPQEAEFHIKRADGLLTIASSHVGQRERLEPIVRRWYRFVASVYTSAELLNNAALLLRTGLFRFPEDSHLYVARGIIQEVLTRKTLVPDWRSGHAVAGRQRAAEDVLKRATAQYLHAVSVNAHDAEAHLHLGWVRFYLEDTRAKGDFEAALADAGDDTVRYLAHLFLGGLAERENRLADALREYDAAHALGTGHQTPYVAMSRVEAALGHVDRARELALTALQCEETNEDPWLDHRIGFDRESLLWLRREARTP
jgi:tetratricopeptide (TPR) repeat protein